MDTLLDTKVSLPLILKVHHDCFSCITFHKYAIRFSKFSLHVYLLIMPIQLFDFHTNMVAWYRFPTFFSFPSAQILISRSSSKVSLPLALLQSYVTPFLPPLGSMGILSPYKEIPTLLAQTDKETNKLIWFYCFVFTSILLVNWLADWLSNPCGGTKRYMQLFIVV